MAYIEIEMKNEVFKLEYDRASIIAMEKMGYNAFDPTSQLYTNFEILVRGGLIKHHPRLRQDKIEEITDFIINEYGMLEASQNLSELVNEVFILNGKGKKMKRMG